MCIESECKSRTQSGPGKPNHQRRNDSLNKARQKTRPRQMNLINVPELEDPEPEEGGGLEGEELPGGGLEEPPDEGLEEELPGEELDAELEGGVSV